MVQGNNIIIGWETSPGVFTPFYATKSSTIQVGSETIEISSSTTGLWRDYIGGRKNWSVNASFLLLALWHATDSLTAVGQTFHIRFYDRTDASRYMDGRAILKTAKVTATRGNLAQGSWEFVGCGELSEVRE